MAIFLGVSFPLSASAQSIPTEPYDQDFSVDGNVYKVLTNMPIVMDRHAGNGTTINPEESVDGRYKMISFLPMLTLQRKVQDSCTAHQLYRTAVVFDTENGHTLNAALPITVINERPTISERMGFDGCFSF